MAEESLRNKTVKGVGWSAVDNVAQYAVTFVVGIVLARLLSPDDYGLIGIIGIFTNVCMAIVNSDLSTALIRKNNCMDDDYNTAFIINIIFGVFFYVLLFFCAPLIASFFNRSELVALVRVSSLTLVIGAFSIVQQTRLTKQINFKAQTKITIAASLVSGTLGVAMAFCGCGVWSLVFQTLSSRIIVTTSLCLYNKWMPKLKFSKLSFRDLFGFSWKLTVAHLLDTVWKELYQVVVGKFYSPNTLGQYTRAKSFSNLFSENLTNVIQRVTYPVLSSIQDEETRMRDAYRKIIKTTMFITFVCMFGIAAISEPLIYCLIGPKWHEASTYLPFICIIGSLYPLQSINLNMLQVQGRSDLFLGLEIVKKIVSLGPLFVGAFVGILPMLYASMCTSLIALYLNSYYSGKFLNYSIGQQLRDIIPFYLVSFSIAIPVWFLKYLSISNWIILPLQLSVIFSTFVVLCKIFKIKEYEEVLLFITPIIRAQVKSSVAI